MSNFIEVSTWTEAIRDKGWQGDWTVFYWAWWISWSPFVGMFIARVSKGRTIREFILGVLLIPALLTFLWMTAMGGSAIYLDMQAGNHDLADNIVADAPRLFLSLFRSFPSAS